MSTVNSKPSRLWGREEDRSGIQIPFIAFNLPSLTCISNCRSRNLLPTSSIVLQYLRDVTANLAELNFQESVTFKSQILKKASSYKYMIRTMIRNFHKEHDKLPTFEDLQIDAEHMKSAQWHLAVTSYVSKLALAKALLHIASKYHSRFKSRCLHAIFETKGISWLKELAYSSDRNGSARLSDTIGLQEDIMKMWTECYLELSPSELTAANKLQIKIDASSSTIAFFKGYENVFKESLPWSEIQTQPLRHILALRSILEILQDTPLPSLSAKVLTEISSPRLFDELQEVEERAEFGLLLEIIQSSCWHSLMFERGSSEVIDPLICKITQIPPLLPTSSLFQLNRS